MGSSKDVELTILMPCLNEAETLAVCIEKAKGFLERSGIEGEILIADNGSTDDSQQIAKDLGVRVVDVPEKGYGAALIGGCNAANGKYVIMGDADDSYDFTNLMPFVDKLREGYELVMGNRFRGGIAKGAMPPLHKYLGNPVLSFIGRLFFPSEIKDFHCGLRGYNRESILSINLVTTGMEYASEMVVKATINKLRITEIPTTLSPDGRTRAPHLRSFRDGWRHLKFLLLYSPDWLFKYPGIVLAAVGLILSILLVIGPITIGSVQLGIHTLLYACSMIFCGVSLVLFSKFTKLYAIKSGILPANQEERAALEKMTTEKYVLVGAVLVLLGLAATIAAFVTWQGTSFGDLVPEKMMRITIPSVTLIMLGIQIFFSGFFIGVLNIKHR